MVGGIHPPDGFFLNNFWNTKHIDLKFCKCAHLLNWHQSSKFCHHMMTSSYLNDVIKLGIINHNNNNFLIFFCWWLDIDILTIGNYDQNMINNKVTCCHLSDMCILQTRVKIGLSAGFNEPNDIRWSNLVKIPSFIVYFEI